MKIGRLLVFLLVLSACGENKLNEIDQSSMNQGCILDTFFISNYLTDVTTIISNRLDFPEDAKLAYRRLEALTTGNYNIDNLSYKFMSRIYNDDTLNIKVIYWLEWLNENKCLVDSSFAIEIFQAANKELVAPKFDKVSLR